ncbi:hypothetical protein [Streptomyces sp. 021-4]|uniref:hypothetical protein n=1 Tax=Streptomyces sp. 021-4 TaxID=2789260 RepID=UPI0039F525D8
MAVRGHSRTDSKADRPHPQRGHGRGAPTRAPCAPSADAAHALRTLRPGSSSRFGALRGWRTSEGRPDPLGHLVDTSEAPARELLRDTVLRAGFSLADDASRHGGADLWEQWHDWARLTLTVARDQGSPAPDADLAGAVAAITAVMAGHATLSRKQRWELSASVVRGFW